MMTVKYKGLDKKHEGLKHGSPYFVGAAKSPRSKAYKQGYFDGGVAGWDTNTKGTVSSQDADYRQGFEDASGYCADEVEALISEKKAKAAAERAVAGEKATARAKRYSERGEFSELTKEQQGTIEADFKKLGVDNKRFHRKSTPTQTDYVYGRVSSRSCSASTTVYDEKFNVLIPYGATGGSGGSLGT
jgi:hypothetical protein